MFDLPKNGPNQNLGKGQTEGDVSYDLIKHGYLYNSTRDAVGLKQKASQTQESLVPA